MSGYKKRLRTSFSEGALQIKLKRKRQHNFFQRHNRIFTFVGAFIVFTTFVLKEGIKERLKDIVSILDSAQTVVIIRMQIAALDRDISRIKDKLDGIDEYGRSGRAVPTKTTIDRRIDSISESVSQTRELISIVGGVADKSGISDFDTVVKNVFEPKLEAIKNDQLDIEGATVRNPLGGNALPRDMVRLSEQTDDLEDRVRGEEMMIEDDLMIALRDCGAYEARYERLYKVCSWTSYGLYTLGWSLTLAGRLFSVEGAIGTE